MPLPADEAWFPRKKFGGGWSLTKTWQGGVVLGVYGALFFVGMIWLREKNPTAWTGYVAVLSALTVGFCWWKGARRGLK